MKVALGPGMWIRSALAVLVPVTVATLVAACSTNDDGPVTSDNNELNGGRMHDRRSIANSIKATAAKRGITNGLLVAGVANHETNMAQCVADYFTRNCLQTGDTPRSGYCNGDSVLIGNSDGTCGQGGIGMFQIDKGTQEQTIAAVGARVLELDGNVDIGIDNIIGAVHTCVDTPDFGPTPADIEKNVVAWMNRAQPGSAEYDTFMGCITQRYNGCGKACRLGACNCDYNQRKSQYAGDTNSLITEFGAAFWNTPAGPGAPPDPGTPPPAAAECAVRPADHKLWCTNKLTSVFATPSATAAVVDDLKTTFSWFDCWAKGELHAGGNTTWYHTLGDTSGAPGYVPAVALSTPDDLDANPTAKGLAECAP